MEKTDAFEEVLEFAIEREIEAYEFYTGLAEYLSDDKVREMFEQLAEEELEHKAKLELELVKLGKTITIREVPEKYVKKSVLIGDKVSLDMDYKDMLLMAIEKEEASFRTYVNLLPNAYEQETREVLMAIAEEEVAHKLRFQNEYNQLMKKQ
ncbi:MAG: ferritin family protein [Planctomycetes bacterium]|nr:ferritin family protein [Planctomycetota bacterium]